MAWFSPLLRLCSALSFPIQWAKMNQSEPGVPSPVALTSFIISQCISFCLKSAWDSSCTITALQSERNQLFDNDQNEQCKLKHPQKCPHIFVLCLPSNNQHFQSSLFFFSHITTTSVSSERRSLPTTTMLTSQLPTRGCSSAWVRTAEQNEETECHPPWRWHISCQGSTGLINRLHLDFEIWEELQHEMHFHSKFYASVSYLISCYVYIHFLYICAWKLFSI